MVRNVGGMDKTVRIVLGIVLLAVGLLATPSATLKVLFLVVGGIALVSGLVGYCPLNRVLGINTCRVK